MNKLHTSKCNTNSITISKSLCLQKAFQANAMKLVSCV